MTGLAPKTLAIFESVSTLLCIKGFQLVGGTSIALQVNHRLSEDLDFCKWVSNSNAANGIETLEIENELKSKFKKVSKNQLSFDQTDFFVDGVKLTFFNEVGFNVPVFTPQLILGNIQTVPLSLVASMKIKTMFERNTFRDYYDVFVLLKEGIVSLDALIDSSISYHSKLKKQMILRRLQSWDQVIDEKGFHQLSPKYNISVKEIGAFFKSLTTV
jgi:hypothetical protein